MKPVLAGLTLQQVLILFAALSFIPLGLEVGLLHYRAKFYRWAMWTPVVFTPAGVLSGLAGGLWMTGASLALLQALMWIAVLVGGLGFLLHLWQRFRSGMGLTLKGLLYGPPLLAPLSISSTGLLALLAIYLAG
jgi:hypothetical protein